MNSVYLNELWPIMEEQILAGKTVKFGPKGISMLPLIRQNIDSIVLKKAPQELNKYDLPLYRRDDGHFVLHRVVGKNSSGYIMCGDNQSVYEHGVRRDQILAIAVGMYRGNEYVSFDNETYIKYTHKQVRKQLAKRYRRKFRNLVISCTKALHIYEFCRKIKNFNKTP